MWAFLVKHFRVSCKSSRGEISEGQQQQQQHQIVVFSQERSQISWQQTSPHLAWLEKGTSRKSRLEFHCACFASRLAGPSQPTLARLRLPLPFPLLPAASTLSPPLSLARSPNLTSLVVIALLLSSSLSLPHLTLLHSASGQSHLRIDSIAFSRTKHSFPLHSHRAGISSKQPVWQNIGTLTHSARHLIHRTRNHHRRISFRE